MYDPLSLVSHPGQLHARSGAMARSEGTSSRRCQRRLSATCRSSDLRWSSYCRNCRCVATAAPQYLEMENTFSDEAVDTSGAASKAPPC